MTSSLVRSASFGTAFALLITGALACGGLTNDPTPDTGRAGTGGTGGTGGSGAAGKGGKAGKGGSTSGTGGRGGSLATGGTSAKGGAGGLPSFEDPGCPNPPPPLEDYACDPYGSFGACGANESCYPYVDYPSAKCGQEIYGAVCTPAGEGKQGEGCELGCVANHVCVVTGEGTQCVRLCDLNAAVPCAGGLVCAPVDIPGIGGCI